MANNKLELDLNEILVDVIKLDKNLQESIKNRVKEKIIDSITEKFLDEYYKERWHRDEKELKDEIVKELSADREEFVKRILKEFTQKLSYYSSDRRKKAYEEFKKGVEELYKNVY